MNKKQFDEILEQKFKTARAEIEVLRLVLDGYTDSEIAQLRKCDAGTGRNQLSKVYKKFGIKREFPGDKPQKDQLKDLFRQHKPEWVNNDISSSAHEKRKQLENITNNCEISLVPLDSATNAQSEEDLISLAISILEQIGFDEIFKKNKVDNYVGYRLKNPGTADKRYQIFITEDAFGLTISINKKILEPYLLNLKYWVVTGNSLCENIAGIFLVIPGKENLFLSSLQRKYWNILEAEGKTIGNAYLTEKCLDGFNKYNLSNRDSYLVIEEAQELNYMWEIVINSREVLTDFFGFFNKIFMNIELYDMTDDDMPF